MLGICIVFGAALFVAVLLPRNAGLAGLALTSALNLTGQPPQAYITLALIALILALHPIAVIAKSQASSCKALAALLVQQVTSALQQVHLLGLTE